MEDWKIIWNSFCDEVEKALAKTILRKFLKKV